MEEVSRLVEVWEDDDGGRDRGWRAQFLEWRGNKLDAHRVRMETSEESLDLSSNIMVVSGSNNRPRLLPEICPTADIYYHRHHRRYHTSLTSFCTLSSLSASLIGADVSATPPPLLSATRLVHWHNTTVG